MKTLIASLALAVLATTASADTVWNYQGNVIDYFQGVVPGPSDISPFALTNLNSTGQIIDSVFGPGNKPFVTWGVDLTGNNGDHIRSSFVGSLKL